MKAGFTLIEVLVALAVGSLVVLVSHQMLVGVADASASAGTAASDLDRFGNRRSWIIKAFANIYVSARPARGFDGVPLVSAAGDSVSFHTRHPDLNEESPVRVSMFVGQGDLLAICLGAAGGRPDTLRLADSVATFETRYLDAYGAESPWLRGWKSPVTAPLAIRIVVKFHSGIADTLFMHVGTRG
jgi:prepilin-type N-terminal cleavage/methylation domain-containing protein